MPSDFREDIMGAFYLKLMEHNMAALRCFDWDMGSASSRWLSFLVRQCATDYLTAMFDHAESYAPVKAALGLADEGGVLASGRERFRGSLGRRVRREKERAAVADAKTARKERRRRRRSMTRK